MNTTSTVYDLLRELSGLDTVTAEQSLEIDLALDSLNMVTMLVVLEDTLGITLDEADMNPFALKTVADVMVLAEKYGGENHG